MPDCPVCRMHEHQPDAYTFISPRIAHMLERARLAGVLARHMRLRYDHLHGWRRLLAPGYDAAAVLLADDVIAMCDCQYGGMSAVHWPEHVR